MRALSKLLSYLLVCSVLFSLSCRDEIIPEKNSRKEIPNMKLTNTEIKKKFGAALAKVLKDSPAVRKLIKDEALKKIDHDYDALYLLIKDEKLSDNSTLEDHLLKYVDPELLASVETQIPNLTIFVPELPENSFSAVLWDVNNEAPCVGVRAKETNDIPAFDSNGDEYLIEYNIIPGYPIVVIKENERIVNSNCLTKSISNNIISTKSNSGVTLEFLDDVFNNQNSNMGILKDDRPAAYVRPEINPILYTDDQISKSLASYDIYENVDGWQRDYIYYNITHSNPKGPFQLNYSEYLVGFEMTGDAYSAYTKIADQTGDPKFDKNVRTSIPSGGRGGNPTVPGGWTDGEFEFEIKMYLGSRTAVGSELIKYLRLDPSRLFNLKPIIAGGGRGSNLAGYTIDGVSLVKANVLLPLFEWNLENYSPSIKIGIEEVDGTETIVNTTSSETEFASNFSYDIGFGEDVKIGLKFGASNKERVTTTTQISTTVGNDKLGEVSVNFGDQIIFNKKTTVYPPGRNYHIETTVTSYDFNSKYETGYCRLYIAPLKNN